MIKGAATVEGTRDFAARFPDLTYRTLGRTKWSVSQAGFGCYRVSDAVGAHSEAMRKALLEGVNLVDTSTNYSDGRAESLVGRVLEQMVDRGRIARQQVVVISKIGYLQGTNYTLSQERKRSGRAFSDLVPYGAGLEHCIHPEFIDDQLSRSLERLQMDTLDVLLLHNPEYYLGWAREQGMQPQDARNEFYRRIKASFDYLETQVDDGRIQCYGVSSNTLPAAGGDPEFVSLDRLTRIARAISPDHHFKVVQFPLNVFEPGAVLTVNQPGDATVLSFARDHELGVVVNRPLNAFSENRLVRLAEIETIHLHTDGEIIAAIGEVGQSETVLWRKLLPALNLPVPLYQRIKDQAAVGSHLKHYWRNFGSYERWRQFKEALLWPRLQGVFDYLEQFAGAMDDIRQWIDAHRRKLVAATRAVGSRYTAEAASELAGYKETIKNADPHWNVDGINMSQLAVRVLRSTQGVSSVLVGMRQSAYVDDILNELRRSVPQETRTRGMAGIAQITVTELAVSVKRFCQPAGCLQR